jgi:hypothetical protein
MSSDQAKKAISNFPKLTIGVEKKCSNWYVTQVKNANLMTNDLCNQICSTNGFIYMGLT